MGSKKDKIKINIKCPYNDRGFCKFGYWCNYKHYNKGCKVKTAQKKSVTKGIQILVSLESGQTQ